MHTLDHPVCTEILYLVSSSSAAAPLPPPPLGPVSMIAPVSTAAVGLLCNPKYCIQHRFHNPMPRMKRQRSLTEAVRMSFSSTTTYPKTLKHWRAIASQQQIMCCTVSASFMQNLQVGSPSNRPMVRRCVLTGACPVRITTTILSWCLLNLSRSAVPSILPLSAGNVVIYCWMRIIRACPTVRLLIQVPKAVSLENWHLSKL
jgi:hypothetical protein